MTTSPPQRAPGRAFARKSVEALQREAGSNGLKRTLGPFNVLFLGIGCIIGAGIYVMTGNAAANFAGPAVVLSFVLAGAACALTALCYAELASTMPVSGSAYTYCYAALGEVFAWTLGWLLILEYGLASATLALGFSGYFTSLMGDLGVHLPAAISTPYVQSTVGQHGAVFHMTGDLNLVAAAAILSVMGVLVVGVTESAFVNNLIVMVKTLVLAGFVIVGVSAVKPHNWTPFIPPNEGGFAYGWPGVLRGASILFFAYLGFETVSTAASETKNPQRDMPFGILGSLAVCTVIYIVVSTVLTGVVPYRELGVPDPIAVAVDRMGRPEFALVIKFGALMGLSSVLLVNGYGQSRIAFAMARDGLLPPLFCALHRRFRTPWLGTILLGLFSASAAAFLPITLLGDLVSLGTALAFSIVCLSVMWLRSTRPDLPRPFSVPLGGFHVGQVWIGYVPVGAILLCWTMIVPVALDLVREAMQGNRIPVAILGIYAAAGAAIYLGYGLRASRPALALVPSELEGAGLLGPPRPVGD
ncbi:MAG: amino acid permease [Caulobacteraceae bacterium]|nr:amino acid permease [Caulobacteraceae bacterium]